MRTTAQATRFGPAAQHYPGLRAPLPETYVTNQQPILAAVLRDLFGHGGDFDVIDASFSVVTRSPAALTLKQRLPHCDAFVAERIALVHYLCPSEAGGTAFYRHRSSGFETIDEGRAPGYFGQLNAELASAGPPAPSYMAGDTALFERTMLVEARYNRAVIYRSFLLHSGAIPPQATLSADPSRGRLTITAFLSTR